CTGRVAAQEFRLDSVGARFGAPISSSGRDFLEAQTFVDWRLPWVIDPGEDWHLLGRLEFSAGWLGAGDDQGAGFALGPTLVIQPPRLPLSLEAGISPTALTRYEYGPKNFGTYFQFTTRAGLNWDFAPHWRLGGFFQHMSNAGLSSHNPGLNMTLFGISYLF